MADVLEQSGAAEIMGVRDALARARCHSELTRLSRVQASTVPPSRRSAPRAMTSQMSAGSAGSCLPGPAGTTGQQSDSARHATSNGGRAGSVCSAAARSTELVTLKPAPSAEAYAERIRGRGAGFQGGLWLATHGTEWQSPLRGLVSISDCLKDRQPTSVYRNSLSPQHTRTSAFGVIRDH